MSVFSYRAASLALVVAAHAAASAYLLSYVPARAKIAEPAAVTVSLITPAPSAAPRESSRTKPAKKRATEIPLTRRAPAKATAAEPAAAQPVIAASPTAAPAPVTVTESPVSPVAAEESIEKAVVAARAVQPAVASPQPSSPAPAAPVVPPSFAAGYLNNPPPAYPPLSRRMREEGRVVLRVFVNERGLPDQVELRTSSGHVRLDEVARDTVKHWKFVPARHGETSISAWVLVPIAFNLRS